MVGIARTRGGVKVGSVNLGCNFGLKLRDNPLSSLPLRSLKSEPEHEKGPSGDG